MDRNYNIKIPGMENYYIQSKQGIMFYGQGLDLSCDINKNACFVLYNPKNSKVDIAIDRVLATNLSPTSIRENMYLCTYFDNCLKKSNRVCNPNTYLCNKNPNGEVFYGTNMKINNDNCVLTAVVSPLSTRLSDAQGSKILKPGTCYIVELIGLSQKEVAKCIVSFVWSEIPIEKNCNCN